MLNLPPLELEKRSKQHLERFKYASRGRRGLTPLALSENEWWALGQHFGLATPLLDWTQSPFAALYFAFEEASSEISSRAVYALDTDAVLAKTAEVIHGPSIENGRLPVVEIVEPMSDENQRLVSQGGCFTRAPIGISIEQWIEKAFEGTDYPALVRIELPNSERLGCLESLTRMNINHLSLFPDLIGASRSTNLRLEFIHRKER